LAIKMIRLHMDYTFQLRLPDPHRNVLSQ
jgi:hypothetical protein